MLQKPIANDPIEQVRSDPCLRELLDWYRRIDPEVIERLNLDRRMWHKRHFGKNARDFGKETSAIFSALGLEKSQIQAAAKRSFGQDALSIVINRIAKVYKDVTGKSPRTTDVDTGKHPFSDFVGKLFEREGLAAPGVYAVRQATAINQNK